jgi:hypothetical protein
VASGHNVYFPDDAHWNTAGHEIASRVLGDFVQGSLLPGLSAASGGQ